MALEPADREALRIYADPSISPADKARLLGGDPSGGIPMPAPIPNDVSGLGPTAVAGPGGGDPSDRAAVEAAMAAPSPTSAPAAAPPGIPSAPPPGGFIPDPSVASKPGIAGTVAQLKAEGPQPNPDTQPEAAPAAGPGGAPQPGNGDYRGALRLMAPQAGAPVPTEQVHESTSMSGSSVDPAQIAAIKEAKERADADEMQRQIAEARIAQQSGEIQLAAEKQAQAEKVALAATRQQAMARADQILAQQEQIGQRIINTGPIMPGTMSSDNWSDTLFTVLSIFGAGAGASSPEKAAEAVGRIANREVARQQAEVDKNKGDLATLDTLYGKHLENLKDHELAKSATIADIYGRAQAEIQGMIQQNGQAPDSVANRKLQAQASALGAQRAEYMADVQAKLGPKVEQQEAVSFMRKHLEPKPAAPVAAPGAPAVSGVPTGKGQGMPHDGAPAVTAPANAVNQSAKLWNEGKPREALALLPPTIKAAVMAQAKRSQKGLGDGATQEDALAYALHDMSNGQFQIPTSFIPQSAREKLVQIPGGAQGFATGKAQADELQKDFNNDSALVGAYAQLLSLANKPASAWTPEMRTKIEAISALIRPMTAHAMGQKGMSAQEQELFDGISGHDINSVKDFLLGTGKAAAEQALQITRSRIRARARSLSRDPFDFVPIEGN